MRKGFRELWKKLALAVGVPAAFFLILEGALVVAGVVPVTRRSDPLVGFASNSRLFIPQPGEAGQSSLRTAPGKADFFNVQSFSSVKQPGHRRVFCLGGSTTYGRPYDDSSSFAGWLRELLPLADPAHEWEVINAGGISYASYRVAALMEELVEYEPDLFVVYSGHNEFLEERTYGSVREMPALVKASVSVLSRSRLWAAMGGLMGVGERNADSGSEERTILPERVGAKLDQAAGLDLYERDDELKVKILDHYRLSLERMARIARQEGVGLIFVAPASNLKDCSPFKSQPSVSAELSADARRLLEEAADLERNGQWLEAVSTLDRARAADPRYAEVEFRRGRALMALGRFEEAKAAFRAARDEDVCPLRALSDMRTVLLDVASRENVPVVDFESILEQRTLSEHGHSILGEEYFLDHVHPTVEGHRILATELVEAMSDKGLLALSDDWTEEGVRRVASKVEGRLDQDSHARALAKLSLVLDWAGKKEDSRRLAFQALEMGSEDPLILSMVARHEAMGGRGNQALGYFRRSLQAGFNNPNVHFQLGLLLQGRGDLEAAAAHLFLATVLSPGNEQAHRHLASVMLKRGKPGAALTSYLEAQRLNPQSRDLSQRISVLRNRLGSGVGSTVLPKTGITEYPSGAPRVFSQARPDSSGRFVSDGIRTEWYENGALKRFADYGNNVPNGTEVLWDIEGNIESRAEYRQGSLLRESSADG